MSCRTITRPHVWVVCQCKREACRLVYCDVCGYDDRATEPCQGEFTGQVAERLNAAGSNPAGPRGSVGPNPTLSSIKTWSLSGSTMTGAPVVREARQPGESIRFATVGASW